jgi:hypothetical protein
MLRSTILLSLIFFAATSAIAQTRSGEPWPELKKLDYFVGDWFEEAEVKAGPQGPGGRVTMHDHREWMNGKFFIVIRSKFTALKGDGTGIAFMGYDPNAKAYTYDEFYSQGEADHSKGHLEGDQWIWNMNDMKMGSQMVKARYTVQIISPTFYKYKFETSSDNGQTWTLTMDGTGRKQSKAKAAKAPTAKAASAPK